MTTHADAEDAETQSGQPGAELPEATPKWLCRECGEVCTEHLSAPNPFDAADQIVGCPHCKSAECLVGACQADGCSREASSGIPGGNGYRYFWACWKHVPGRPA